jgi:hypothetical protein
MESCRFRGLLTRVVGHARIWSAGARAMSVLERDEMRVPIRFDLANESGRQWDTAERASLRLARVERPPEKVHRNGRTIDVLGLFVHNHERGRRDWIRFFARPYFNGKKCKAN